MSQDSRGFLGGSPSRQWKKHRGNSKKTNERWWWMWMTEVNSNSVGTLCNRYHKKLSNIALYILVPSSNPHLQSRCRIRSWWCLAREPFRRRPTNQCFKTPSPEAGRHFRYLIVSDYLLFLLTPGPYAIFFHSFVSFVPLFSIPLKPCFVSVSWSSSSWASRTPLVLLGLLGRCYKRLWKHRCHQWSLVST